MNPTANNVGAIHLGFHRKEPFVKQAALLKDSDSWSTFLNALMSKKVKLYKRSEDAGGNWYGIVPCSKANSLKDMPVKAAEPVR